MAYTIKTTKTFYKDMERCIRRSYRMDELREVMKLLERNGSLPAKYRPHRLHGNRKGQWKAHIQPNWLLIWEQHDTELILIMLNTGTHSDLFSKNIINKQHGWIVVKVIAIERCCIACDLFLSSA